MGTSITTDSPISVRLTFVEGPTPPLLAVSSLLYDLELVHDLGILVTDERYAGYEFTQFFYRRNGRPLLGDHRLKARSIQLQSPLALELIFGGIAAVWALVQVAEKARDWRLNRRKLAAEVEKLEAERDTARLQEATTRAGLEKALDDKEAAQILNRLARRLDESIINLTDLEFLDLER